MAQNEEIYDIAAASTSDFANISAAAILSNSRIIKILRYAIAPSISQMKFGQVCGLKSVKPFEEERLQGHKKAFRDLKRLAPQIAKFASDGIDQDRFRWLAPKHGLSDVGLAKEYARKWTCSIAANQNAQTRYRNWRKDQQEHSIASTLVGLGYTKSGFAGTITKKTDVKIGEFTTEKKVTGRTTQKADLVVRSKKVGNQLVLIEAKAVGVELDSTKRIKECCDKSNDWASSNALGPPEVIAVIAGFFNAGGIANLQASKIGVVWEHRLSDLGVHL
jgi:hypothetical protein